MSRVKTGAGNVRRSLAHIRDTREQVEGVFVQRLVVTCSACGTGWPFPWCPPELVDKNLTQRGWSRPTDPRRATCAKCIAKCIADGRAAKAAPAKSEKEVIPMPQAKPAPVVFPRSVPPHQGSGGVKPDPKLEVVVQVAAEAPRMPSREDNRRIRDALDLHYDDGGQYYSGDMTDAILAEILKVPRAWVSDIREQLYGPDLNYVGVKAVATAADLEKRLTTAIEDALNRAADMETLRAEVRAFLASTGKAA